MDKLSYEAPIITVVGSLSAITQADANGQNLDAAFPNNTPQADLTFS
ncbi:MAG: lasso RiPP family leader peptide-containing protein [Mycobacteriales bacterium]